MTSESVSGLAALYRLTHSEEIPADLSVREKRLLDGALNFHALMAPGRRLQLYFYDGTWESLPRLTDDSSFNGLSRAFRARLFDAEMESLVAPEERVTLPAEEESIHLAGQAARHLHVSRDDVIAYDPPRHIPTDPLRRVARAIRARTPLMYDEVRDVELLRHRRSYTARAVRRNYAAEFAPGGVHDDTRIVPASPAPDGAVKAVLFGLHWFELGGAERWAFESVRIAREAGFLPIVLSNRDSHQPWISRQELDGALIIPFSEATVLSQTAGIEELLRAILRTFDVRGVVVHHNQWLYDRLDWIALSRPDIPIVDSTHIVEYRGGGFPLSSVLVDDAITIHHTISPKLAQWMTETQGVAAEKVVMAPLGGLTVEPGDATFRHRVPGAPFTVAFVGRMARQKAPEVFVQAVHRLMNSTVPMRFIMHGDGEMATWVTDVIRGAGLEGVIERRTSAIPVAATLDEADLLVVSSHNEGLTLTTLEAIAHGLPVISTDVGAQSDIIPTRGLVSRNVHLAVRQIEKKVTWLAEDETARELLWQEEHAAEQQLTRHASASEWFAREVSAW
ncbi:glycosyltransferase [uncultured Microbacterium sp.]|uniref:glycosyltransferase n=1 Tax=uncultured Microbacterium sp. TaxID=191216 RepID=UPI00262E7508|nr:glycosyltransferase [uncultured Microbacterium sp.]